MAALTKQERFFIAHEALMILTFIPSVILFFCSLCLCRRRRDPARTGFTYLKLLFPVFNGVLFLDICAYGLALASSRVTYELRYDSDYDDLLKALFLGQVHVGAIARLFDSFVDILAFFVLTRITTGIVIAKEGHIDLFGKILRFGSYFMAVLLGALAFAHFGLLEKFYNGYYDDYFFDDDERYYGSNVESLVNKFEQSRKIDFAFLVFAFILALVVVGRSIMVKLQSRTEAHLSTASNIAVACAFLWLLRTTYGMAMYVSIVDLDNVYKDPEYKPYFDILNVVFGFWPMFALLCLIFGLGVKKRGGLWSTEQPFMMEYAAPGAQQTPWGYVTGPVPPKEGQQQPPMHNGWQPQQQEQQPPVQNGWQPQQQQQQQQQQPPIPQPYYANTQQNQPIPQQYGHYDPTGTRSPPPHEETMGLNHQANGSPPQAAPQPYNEKM